jgi:hypothetical protein
MNFIFLLDFLSKDLLSKDFLSKDVLDTEVLSEDFRVFLARVF